jgi:hypothetical protein
VTVMYGGMFVYGLPLIGNPHEPRLWPYALALGLAARDPIASSWPDDDRKHCGGSTSDGAGRQPRRAVPGAGGPSGQDPPLPEFNSGVPHRRPYMTTGLGGRVWGTFPLSTRCQCWGSVVRAQCRFTARTRSGLPWHADRPPAPLLATSAGPRRTHRDYRVRSRRRTWRPYRLVRPPVAGTAARLAPLAGCRRGGSA